MCRGRRPYVSGIFLELSCFAMFVVPPKDCHVFNLKYVFSQHSVYIVFVIVRVAPYRVGCHSPLGSNGRGIVPSRQSRQVRFNSHSSIMFYGGESLLFKNCYKKDIEPVVAPAVHDCINCQHTGAGSAGKYCLRVLVFRLKMCTQ